MATWLTINLVDSTAGRLIVMSLLRFFLKPGGGDYCFLYHNVVQKAANIEVATLLENKRVPTWYITVKRLRAKIGQYADHG